MKGNEKEEEERKKNKNCRFSFSKTELILRLDNIESTNLNG